MIALADRIACPELRVRELLLLQEARFSLVDALRSFMRDLGLHDAAELVSQEISEFDEDFA